MWLNAHCANGRNDRRYAADSRQITADIFRHGNPSGLANCFASHSWIIICDLHGNPSPAIGMSVAKQCCMNPETNITTSTTRSA